MPVLPKSNLSSRAIAVHVLAQTGELPALYRAPKSQIQLEKQMAKELRKALLGIGSGLVKELGKSDRMLSPENLFGYFDADIKARAKGLEAAFEKHMGLAMGTGFVRGSKEVREMLGLVLTWSLKNPDVQRILAERSFVASEKTIERMKGDVMAILRRGYDEGLGNDAVGKLLRDAFDGMTHQRLEMISRTEIGSAQNLGAMESYIKAEVARVQWLASLDDRTRESHMMEHGRIVKLGEKFPVTGLDYPGDKSGPIEEWINCRCAVAPIANP